MKKDEVNSNGLPLDLGLVIGTKEQSRWQTIQENAKQQDEQLKLQKLVNDLVLEKANLELKDLNLTSGKKKY